MFERVAYRGWDNACRLSNGRVELIVTGDVGPRIISYKLCNAENLFHEVEEDAGKIGGSKFRLYGGHRLWVSPEVERTYFPDNRPVVVSHHGRTTRFTAEVEDSPPGTSLQKELEVELSVHNTEVQITHRIRNCDSQPTRLAPWSPTMLRAGGRAILPLPPRVAMDKDHYLSVGAFGIWSFTDFADPRWIFGTSFVQLRQIPNPGGRFREQMGGIYNPAGWGAYYWKGHLFVKRAAVTAGATYPDFGCNFQVFTDPEFLELETLDPVTELQPGEAVEHVEHWWLFADVVEGEDDGWIEASIVPLIDQTEVRRS